MTLSADVLVVGAGPCGLFAVFQCGMLGLRCIVVDGLNEPGGQCAALYPEKPIYDIPGFKSIDGLSLVDNLLAQAMVFEPVMRLGTLVQRIEKTRDSRFRAHLADGKSLEVGAVIVAAGGGAFAPNRPDLADIAAFEQRSLFYAVPRLQTLTGQRIVIAGGGDSAVDWALALHGTAKSITLVHRRAKFRAAAHSLSKLDALVSAGAIDLAIPYQLAELVGDRQAGRLSAVIVATLQGERRTLEADTLLPCFGFAAALGPILDWKLAIERDRIAVEPTTCETSIDGIFAIGDVAHYPNKLPLILTGFADAAQAAHAVRNRLKPDEAHWFEHSTSRGVPERAASMMEMPA